jgi:hypothetical protein
VPYEIRQRSTIEPYDLVRDRIINFNWTFLATPPVLITSDNPVRYPEHEGLGHFLGFLNFPISPTLTLLAGTKDATDLLELPTASTDCGTASASDHQAAILNHLTITGAHRYLYSPEASEELSRTFG